MYFYPIVSTLIIINFVLWAIVHLFPFEIGTMIWQWGAGQNILIHNLGQYWRFITPIFLHADLTHTLFNSFALVLFGPALEQMLGKNKFIIAYLLAGIAGNIGTYVVDPTSYIVHIGASGSVYGLFGMYIFMVLFRKSLINPGDAQIITTIFLIGLVMTFIRPGINIYAHVFGFIGGLALGPAFLTNAVPFSIYRNPRPRRHKQDDSTVQFDPNRWNKRRSRKKLSKTILWIVFGVLVIIGLLGKVF